MSVAATVCAKLSLVALTLAHLSDTHLGFRAFSAVDPQGVNQREVDVMGSFSRCLNAILERDPDIVVHSGDFFHVVRPGNHSIIGAFRRLSAFQQKRDFKPFLLVAGNHDTPRSSDLGNLLHLFAAIEGVQVYAGRGESFEIPALDLEVLAVPHNSLVNKENIAWTPQTSRKNSLLVLHGMEAQVAVDLKTEGDFEFRDTGSERWTYVALGDVHTHHPYTRNACYSGATDFTSSNIWLEAKRPKGWVYFDAAQGELEFVAGTTRELYDLPWIDATDLTAEQLEDRLAANAKWPESQRPIVRQVVQNLSREVSSRLRLDWRQGITSRCLNYQLETRRPLEAFTPRGAETGPSMTLEMEWIRHMETAVVPPGLDAKKVSDAGVALLKEVEIDEADPA